MENITDFVIEFWHWFALAAALGAVEMLAPGVFFLWLGLAAFITGLLLLVFPDLSTGSQLVIYGILSVALVYAAWKYMKGRKIKTDQPLLNQRGAQYIGKTAVIEEAIIGGHGRARMGDTTWKVEGADMAVGTVVKIVGFDGPQLKVEKLADAPAPAAADAPAATAAEHDPRLGNLAENLHDPLDRKE